MMQTLTIAAIPGVVALEDHAHETTGSGFPVAPIVITVGGYLLKTVGDHWGDFKEGVAQGFRAVWGQR